YDIAGEFWNVSLKKTVDPEMGLGTLHKPLQRPHPPIAVPCISHSSAGVRKAGARGFSPFSHHMIPTVVLADHWKTYEEGARSAGREPHRSDWRVARNIFVADTTAEARRLARGNSLGQCIQYILELTRRGPGLGMWKGDPAMSDADCNLDYFMEEVIIAGNPDDVIRRLRELRQEIGDFGTLVLVAHDWDDKQRWLRSLELFAREVMPAV
ncbi:MAG TPA: LLM class flavin-dependent oxidoreductase, partial [Gemmataceae bacterium]|nr:LLM class flavin-dependent oxidoreductase [Gemmataceae bacterium]